MRTLFSILLLAAGFIITAFIPGPENTYSTPPPGNSTRDSVVTCVDSIYKKYTAGLREFNDLTYLGPFKPDSVKWLNLCGKGMGNKNLDGKLLNKMKNLQVLDLGFRDVYSITSTVLNGEEPSEAKKKKLDRDVAGGWEYYYQNKRQFIDEKVLTRQANNISELPKELASLKKLKLLVLCGNPLPPEDVTKLRKALPNTLIVFE